MLRYSTVAAVREKKKPSPTAPGQDRRADVGVLADVPRLTLPPRVDLTSGLDPRTCPEPPDVALPLPLGRSGVGAVPTSGTSLSVQRAVLPSLSEKNSNLPPVVAVVAAGLETELTAASATRPGPEDDELDGGILAAVPHRTLHREWASPLGRTRRTPCPGLPATALRLPPVGQSSKPLRVRLPSPGKSSALPH